MYIMYTLYRVVVQRLSVICVQLCTGCKQQMMYKCCFFLCGCYASNPEFLCVW